MPVLQESHDLERRKQVRLRRRPGLVITPQQRGRDTCFVVKDPVRLRYFQLEPNQRFLFDLMDGERTLAEIQHVYEEKSRPDRLSLEELEAFAVQLLEGGLVQNESPLAAQLLHQRTLRQQRRTFWLVLLNFLCYRLPLGSPDRVLDKLSGLGRFLFHRGLVVVSVGVFACATAVILAHWQSLIDDFPSFRDFFGWKNLLLFWCILGVVKILHELGHGLCCKAMGGQVQGMGVMFLMFFPTLYCDVSDSWRLSNKWKRMAVAAAGMYVELWITSLAALTWWATEPGTLIHHACLGLVLVGGATTLLCNGNPLMRFDGYYILSDWLETPNLGQQSSQFLRTAVVRGLGFQSPWGEPQGRMGRGFLIGFGLASLIYRWVLICCTLFLVYSFFQAHQLAGVGSLVIVLGMGGMLCSQAFNLGEFLRGRRRLLLTRPARLALAVALTVGVLMAFFFVPLPHSVRGVVLIQVEPEAAHRIVVTEAGFLQEIVVRDGQRVKAGEVLAVLTNPKLDIALRMNEADQALRRRQMQASVTLDSEDELPDYQERDVWAQQHSELRSLAQSQRTLEKQRERLVLRAPADGIVQGLQSREYKGKWLEKGTELCRIGNERALRALLLVDAADQRLIGRERPAQVYVRGGHRVRGAVAGVAPANARDIPPQLSLRVGGTIATKHDDVTNTEVPHAPHYRVAIRLLESDARLHPGILGNVKIEADAQTLWWRCRRFLGSKFNWGL